jgi:hypothetical protein
VKNYLLNGNWELVPTHWYSVISKQAWVADGWYFAGTSGITGNFQFGKYGNPLGTNPQSAVTFRLYPNTSQATIPASDQASLFTWLEGSVYATICGGSFTVAGQIYASVTGTYSIAVRNGAGSQSYVHAITIGAAGWNAFSFTVPSPASTAGFSYTAGSVGLIIGIALGVSSSLQTSTVDAWQSGNFYAATGQVNLLAGVETNLAEFGLYVGSSAPAVYPYAVPHESALRAQRYLGYSAQKQLNVLGSANDMAGDIGVPANNLGAVLAVPHGSAANYAMVPAKFEVEMCSLPAVSIYSNGVIGAASNTNQTPVQATGLTPEAATLTVAQIGRIIASGTAFNNATGNTYTFHYFADARPALT